MPFNQPQEKPGVTDCATEIKSLDRWQPLCVPVSFGSKECKVTAGSMSIRVASWQILQM